MKTKQLTRWALVCLVAFFSILVNAQVRISDDGVITDPDPSAILDIKTSLGKGLLLPRVANTSAVAAASLKAGMMVFSIADDCVMYYNGTKWMSLCECSSAPQTPGTITFTITGATVNLNGTFKASVTPVEGATEYSWALPPGLSGNSSTNEINITVTGTTLSAYPGSQITVQAKNACGTSATREGTGSINVTTYANTKKCATFTKNNCTTGGTGSALEYCVNAATYTSMVSQAAADQLAQNEVNANGQAYANTNGTCTYTYWNVAKSGSFTKNNCGTGYTGSTMTYIVPANTYSSTVSQAAANQLAQNDVNANGQAYANSNGSCTANSYTVTYYGNGGTPNSQTRTRTYGQNFNAPATEPTRTGYSLTGWNTSSTGSGTTYTVGTTKVYNDVTVYAQWVQDTYTVTYNSNGGSPATAQTKSHNYGSTLTSPTTTPTRTGYTFTGWNTSSTGSGTTYTVGSTTITSNVTLYAQWTAAAKPNPQWEEITGEGTSHEGYSGRYYRMQLKNGDNSKTEYQYTATVCSQWSGSVCINQTTPTLSECCGMNVFFRSDGGSGAYYHRVTKIRYRHNDSNLANAGVWLEIIR